MIAWLNDDRRQWAHLRRLMASARQIQFLAIGGPGRNPGAKDVRILSPYRATDRHGARKDGPIIGITYRDSLECLVFRPS